MDNIIIENLAERQEFLEIVSEWIYNEWEKSKGQKLEDSIYRSKHSINKEDIPQMYVAISDNVPVGVVSLWRNDLTSRQDLYPWLATLLVRDKYRNMGIGKMLQEKCIEVARNLGYTNLYLITDHDSYYEKNGWEFLEYAPLNDGKITRIYQYKL